MTAFISVRSQTTAGTVQEATVFEALADRPGVLPKKPDWLRQQVQGKDVLLATHGFNVDQREGITSLARLDAWMARDRNGAAEYLIGVLWPGDWWIPVINYPTEASDAVKSGKHLATFCNDWLMSANSLSFASHSLGARVILEAIAHLDEPARVACITAAAADFDCLDRQYAQARERCDLVANLASRKDIVLKYAYPAGDFISDIFGDDDSPFGVALGYGGPKKPWQRNVAPRQIPKRLEYDHGNYLPPSDDDLSDTRWQDAANFIIRAFRGQPQPWPPAS